MTEPARPATPSNPRLLGTVAYFGGLITGVILLATEKQDRFVRFHATQSVVTFLLVLFVHLMLSGLSVIGAVLYLPFLVTVIGLWIALMIKAWQGEMFKLPYLGDFAERLIK